MRQTEHLKHNPKEMQPHYIQLLVHVRDRNDLEVE